MFRNWLKDRDDNLRAQKGSEQKSLPLTTEEIAVIANIKGEHQQNAKKMQQLLASLQPDSKTDQRIAHLIQAREIYVHLQEMELFPNAQLNNFNLFELQVKNILDLLQKTADHITNPAHLKIFSDTTFNALQTEISSTDSNAPEKGAKQRLEALLPEVEKQLQALKRDVSLKPDNMEEKSKEHFIKRRHENFIESPSLMAFIEKHKDTQFSETRISRLGKLNLHLNNLKKVLKELKEPPEKPLKHPALKTIHRDLQDVLSMIGIKELPVDVFEKIIRDAQNALKNQSQLHQLSSKRSSTANIMKQSHISPGTLPSVTPMQDQQTASSAPSQSDTKQDETQKPTPRKSSR